MQLFRSLQSLGRAPQPRVVAIGVFDGVHIGHQAIIARALQIARGEGIEACALTFEPMPTEFFDPDSPPARLTPFRERVELLAASGLDAVCCLPFAAIQPWTANRFMEHLLSERLRTRAVVVGGDFRFGADRQGSLDSLRLFGAEAGFSVHEVAEIVVDAQRVSSTRIRTALAAGDFGQAERLLGRPFTITGRVGHGLALGRSLGFPTANIALRRRRPPLEGVFAVRADVAGQQGLPGVASLGVRPTIGGSAPLLEVHLFDFDARLYGQRMQVEFVRRLRDEERFEDLEAMVQQMKIDAAAARAALSA